MTRCTIVGNGIVGRRVERFLDGGLLAAFDQVTCGGRAHLPGVLDASDVVVLAGPAPHAPVVAALAASGASFVSVSDDLGDVQELLELHDAVATAGATLVVGAAMSPGLSGLIARLLADRLERADEIHVAAHATAGPACARQHHRSLAGRSIAWLDGEWQERPAGSGRELCWFPEPIGAHDCYRAELADPFALQRCFPDMARITARLSATRRDRLTSRLPMLRRPHPEGGVGALRVEVRGTDARGAREVLIAGVAEFVGAAAGAAAAAFAVAAATRALPAGAVVPGDRRLDTVSLLDDVAACGVRLQEFTGVPQRV